MKPAPGRSFFKIRNVICQTTRSSLSITVSSSVLLKFVLRSFHNHFIHLISKAENNNRFILCSILNSVEYDIYVFIIEYLAEKGVLYCTTIYINFTYIHIPTKLDHVCLVLPSIGMFPFHRLQKSYRTLF